MALAEVQALFSKFKVGHSQGHWGGKGRKAFANPRSTRGAGRVRQERPEDRGELAAPAQGRPDRSDHLPSYPAWGAPAALAHHAAARVLCRLPCMDLPCSCAQLKLFSLPALPPVFEQTATAQQELLLARAWPWVEGGGLPAPMPTPRLCASMRVQVGSPPGCLVLRGPLL